MDGNDGIGLFLLLVFGGVILVMASSRFKKTLD